jgi:hypothetical protein
MVKQAVENMRGVAGIRGDHLRIEGRVLVGDVGVKEHARLIAITEIDLPGLLTTPAGAETLPSDDDVVPSPQRSENGCR